ncbi:MAG: thiamine phosphate synthase [Planctomycetales bacterium]|nr:thiamine phosphate synthase [Planctomycetales bacterium]
MLSAETTPGAARTLRLAMELAGRHRRDVEPEHLLLALVQDESRAANIITRHALTLAVIESRLFANGDCATGAAGSPTAPELSERTHKVLHEAQQFAAAPGGYVEVATEHLLWGLTKVESPARVLLLEFQLDSDAVTARAAEQTGVSTAPLPTEVLLSIPTAVSSGLNDAYRIIDAAANRAREGVRVMEDFARFSLNDSHLTERLKQWRHRFAETLREVSDSQLLHARDTQHDVGTEIHTPFEATRHTILDVVRAACKRVQEALRTLEEYGKILDPALGERLGRLRYESYTLEKALLVTHSARDRLHDRDLYLLVTEDLCHHGSGPAIRGALDGGVSIIQIREKSLPDRQLLEHARRVRDWTRETGALFIMNDRPDLAVLCDADGVHVGQDELTVHDARRIVGPNKLVGVSTHTIEQARQAVFDGADYIGVGPVFPSQTKCFEQFPGLEFVRQVASEIALPAFAIGGINSENVEQVLAAGSTRVAVSSAICGDAVPDEVARRMLDCIQSVVTRRGDAATRRHEES